MEKILLDTNLFIYLEDYSVTNENVLQLTKELYDSDEYKIVIHPKIKEEIEKIKDIEKKEIFKSKIEVYKTIIDPPIPDEKFHALVGCKNEHDRIDNILLFAVYKNCVSFLITNDKDLKTKSKTIGLNDRVLSIEEALKKFKQEPIKDISKPVFINKKFLYLLDINDTFFDSLKEDYAGFEKWFADKQKEHAKAYVSENNGRITSFLMLKFEDEQENYNSFLKPFTPAKRLKVSTFKVADTGKRIGETFIKIIVKEAINLKVDEVYVTVFDKQVHLIDMLNEYGFHYFCKKKTPKPDGTIELENVYIKKIKNPDEYYPFLNLKGRKAFILPIREKYHELLFQDSEKVHQISLDDLAGNSTSANSIRKAFLSRANNRNILPGDILLFYSTKDKKAITSLGVVDAVFNNFKDIEDLSNLIRRRTAYSRNELEKLFKKDILAILFKHYYSFDNYVSFEFLIKNKIVNGSIQRPLQIKKDKLLEILEECKIEKDIYLI